VAGAAGQTMVHVAADWDQETTNGFEQMCTAIYWQVKERLPNVKWPRLKELCVSLGAKALGGLDKRNAKYTSHLIFDEVVAELAGMIEERTLEWVRKATFVSVMADEATDISVTKQLGIYLRGVHCGRVKTWYAFTCTLLRERSLCSFVSHSLCLNFSSMFVCAILWLCCAELYVLLCCFVLCCAVLCGDAVLFYAVRCGAV
jgi:hypothetical protein